MLAKCKYIGQSQHEVHIELLRKELCLATSDIYIEKVMLDTLTHQDQFEVYVQTLISQALDTNFLIEIMQEQGIILTIDLFRLWNYNICIRILWNLDEYFLSNVKLIDDLTTERKLRLRNSMPWTAKILYSIESWPCYNIISELGVTNNGQIICAACNKRNIVSRIILYGQPYNPNTIRPMQLDSRFSFEKVCHNPFEPLLYKCWTN